MGEYLILQDTYNKNGYAFKKIKREGDVAIYEQSHQESPLNRYEVFEIRRQEATEFNGVKYEAKERCPSNEEWGVNAYTCFDLGRAEQIMQDIKHAITEREAQKQEQFT